MSFDFPSPVSEGTYYTPLGGPQYVYVNGAWRMAGAPTVVATAETRNRIVNGAMQISQELGFGSNTSASPAYVADQWFVGFSGGVAAAQFGAAISGSPNLIRASNTTADATVEATEYHILQQPIKGIRIKDFLWGAAGALPAVLRFEACTSTVASLVCSVAVRSGGGTMVSWVKNFTVTTAWQTFTIPIDPPSIGTWPTDATLGMYLAFASKAGSNYRAPAEASWATGSYLGTASNGNMHATANAALNIRNVGLYLDPLATGIAPPWQMPDEAEELRACERYYQVLDSAGFGWGGPTTNAQTYNAFSPFHTTMRATAAASGTNVLNANFGAAVGSLTAAAGGVFEGRAATATGNGGAFRTTVKLNARM